MTDFFTSNLRCADLATTKERGFNTIKEHTEAVVQAMTATLKPKDRLFIIGNIAAANGHNNGHVDQERYVAQYLSEALAQHNTKATVILGPDDTPHPSNGAKARRWQRNLTDLTPVAVDSMEMIIAGHSVLTSYFSYDNAEQPQWSRPDVGNPLLCGELSGAKETIDNKPALGMSRRNSLMINVSLDEWDFAPVSKEIIDGLIREHHNS